MTVDVIVGIVLLHKAGFQWPNLVVLQATGEHRKRSDRLFRRRTAKVFYKRTTEVSDTHLIEHWIRLRPGQELKQRLNKFDNAKNYRRRNRRYVKNG